jgi:cholesterol 24-hydroxylase
MIDDFITFFVAGQETTAGTLAFVFLELGRHPKVLEKLRQEIDDVIGVKPYLTMDDLSELKYTSCVFKEALRLYPPVPAVTRRTQKNIIKNDIFIPANTVINLSTYASGRCEKFFPEPLVFKPERFEKDSNASNIQNYTYYPFSLGPRNCLGQNFAQIEAKILIAKFIQNFDFTLNPTQSYAIADALTLRPKDGVKCKLTMRKI